MFPQGQMQPQLPVPADQLVVQFLNIGPQNPPYVPQLQVPQYMQQFVPYIAGCCAVEIQQQAQNNSMRCFMFNLNAQNNFMNQEFIDTVSAACDYIQLQILKRQHADAGSAAAICVPRVIEMIAAANVYTYPGLQAYVPAQSSDAVNQLVNAFRQTGAEIAQMKQAQAAQLAPQPGYHQQGAYPQQHVQAPNSFVRQPQVSLTGSGQNASLYGGSNVQGPAVRGPGARPDRYANKQSTGIEEVTFEAGQPLKQPVVGRTPAHTHVKATPAKDQAPVKPQSNVPSKYADHELLVINPDGSFLIPAQDSEEVWIPNNHQPYLPAYNPTTHLMFHQIFPDGNVGIVLKELTQEMMDWKQHNMGSAFGPAPKVQKMGARDMDEVWADVKALNHADMVSDVPDVDEAEKVPVWIDSAWKLNTSMEAAILNVRLAHQQACMNEGQELLAFESYASVLTVCADALDRTPELVRLSGVETYVGLAEKLKALKGDIPDNLWYTIDEVMTKTINRLLRKNLSLEITIERFSDDIGPLFSLIEKKGSVIFQAFNANQENTIRTALATIPEDQRNLMDEQLLAGIVDVKLTYLTQETSFTVLDCMSHDLEVELQEGVAVAVLDSLVPEIYGLVHGIFERADAVEAEFARHFILTNDLKVIEVTRGHVGKDFYLMSLVN